MGKPLKVLSWNVNGLSDAKKDCSDFVNIVNSGDIVCLYETWSRVNSDHTLNGYVCHNFVRKFQHRNSKRCSGGIVIYYRENLNPGITFVRNHFESIIWIKLDKAFLALIKMFICAPCIFGAKVHPYTMLLTSIYLTFFKNDLYEYDDLGNVYIFGNMNSRTGLKMN